VSSTFIPYGRQTVSRADAEAVALSLQSHWITQGPAVDAFEEAIAERLGARFAVVVSSGTAALHLACLAAGTMQGHRVITSPNSFVASSTCGIHCGADPEFVDIDTRTYNLDVGSLDAHLVDKTVERRPGVLIPVHFAGQPCDMERISEVARCEGLATIEDACHALGATWTDRGGHARTVGDCSHSDMTVFSFHPVKHITTGEGGAVLTNNEELYHRIRAFRAHGITKSPEVLERQDEGPWYYEMQDLGFNYRMTDFQCELGLRQLEHLSVWAERRREIAARYDELLSNTDGVITPYQMPRTRSSYHLYPIWLAGTASGRRRKVFEAMRAAGIGVQVHYIPIHTQPYFRDRFGFKLGDYPCAESYYEGCLSLPIFPTLLDSEQDYVVSTLEKVLAK
jgi:UDP-4-amino-4,6-dideoxy-N-acetyl-beta-L-altrosamine transaminase